LTSTLSKEIELKFDSFIINFLKDPPAPEKYKSPEQLFIRKVQLFPK
jgi:hypothetical protein